MGWNGCRRCARHQGCAVGHFSRGWKPQRSGRRSGDRRSSNRRRSSDRARREDSRSASNRTRRGKSVSSTVRVCDDAVFMRTMVSDILSQAGFTVVGEAENGKQAVEKYKQLKPDLVTMDIIMPEMGGIEAVKQITQAEPAAGIPLWSAMGQQALVQEALQAGARDFVGQPFPPSRVPGAVQRGLA